MNTQSFRVQALRGIDRRWISKPDAAWRIEDMTLTDRDSWRECGGLRQIYLKSDGSNPFSGLGRISGLHWFCQHNGARQWLLFVTGDGKFRYFNPSDRTTPFEYLQDTSAALFDGSGRSVTTMSTPWQKSQAQCWGSRIYIVNGFDEPMVFNGRYIDRAGFSTPPGTPTPRSLDKTKYHWRTKLTNVGLGRLADFVTAETTEPLEGAYRYVVTFVNERGQESMPSAPSEAAIIENDWESRSFVVLDVPIGGENVVARRIYRTRNCYDSTGQPLDLGYGQDFYFLVEIEDNITRSFEDSIPDTGLGSLMDPDDFGPMPTSTALVAVFKNTLFTAGFQDNTVRYSAPLFPEVYPKYNAIQVGDDDMGEVTGMRPTRNTLVVFKQRGIYLIRGDPSQGFYADTLTRDQGCIAPNSVAEVQGLGMLFLGHDGVYLLRGALENSGTPTEVVKISQNIAPLVESLNKSAAVSAVAAIYHRAMEYWLAIPTIGNSDNNLVLVYHYASGEWSTRIGFPANCLLETRDHRGYLILGSYNTSKEGILVYSHGWQNKLGGESISPVYQTTWLDLASLYSSVHPKSFIPYVVTNGDNTLKLNFSVNKQTGDALTTPLSRAQQDPEDLLPVYGTDLWGSSGTWPSQRPTALRYDISATHKGPVREISFTLYPNDRKVEIASFDIELGIGEHRSIKPLSLVLGPDKE